MRIPVADIKSGNVILYSGVLCTVVGYPQTVEVKGETVVKLNTTQGEFLIRPDDKINLIKHSNLDGGG